MAVVFLIGEVEETSVGLGSLHGHEGLHTFWVPLQQLGKQTWMIGHQRKQPTFPSARVEETSSAVSLFVCARSDPAAALVRALHLQFVHQIAGQKVSGKALDAEFLAALRTSGTLSRPLLDALQAEDMFAGETLRVREDFRANGAVQVLRYGVRTEEGASGGHSMIIEKGPGCRDLYI